VGALADPKVGEYLNEHFVASFQKVGTFRVVESPNGPAAKQGGNVASYFCAPDGRVLHAVAGPVNAATLLREAKWVVDTTRQAMKESQGDGARFKAAFRKAHAAKLRADTGLAVEPITWDPPGADDEKSTLTYRDPSGRPLAPVLPPPPIDGPDVRLNEAEFNTRQAAANAAPDAKLVVDRLGRRVAVNNLAVVHQLLAAHALVRIERVYGTVFENVLGEKVSTRPVDVVTPFPWVDRAGKQVRR
jgi:hypothetical protein